MDKLVDLSKFNLSKTLIFDALNTTVALHDPMQTLKGDEQKLYLLSESPYCEESVKQLPELAKSLGMESEYLQQIEKFDAENVLQKKDYYALCDSLSEKYCSKNNDAEQEMRKSVIKKIYHLVDPEIFPKVVQYSKANFGRSLRVVLLTNANPIMKEVYTQMVGKYGVEVLVAPSPMFDKLRKEEPELYAKIAKLYHSEISNMALLDDSKKNITAANIAGAKTKLFNAGGVTLDSEEGRRELKESATKLVRILNESSGELGLE